MLKVDWKIFSECLTETLKRRSMKLVDLATATGISHTRLVHARQGRSLGTDLFLTLCEWLGSDPLKFCMGRDSSSARVKTQRPSNKKFPRHL
jgi:DNA-binding Xre family transcriptional regulator